MSKYVTISLFLLYAIEVQTEKLFFQCLAAPNDGYEINYSYASFLDTDGYKSLTTKSCSNYLNNDTCGSVDNFKYCKEPKPTFLLRSLGDKLKVWVVSNRCEGGFKKYERVGNDKDEMYLYEEKMVYQMRNQIWAGTRIERQPVLILTKENDLYKLQIEEFTENLWFEEWDREDIDISYFSEESGEDYEISSYTTYCIENDKFESPESLSRKASLLYAKEEEVVDNEIILQPAEILKINNEDKSELNKEAINLPEEISSNKPEYFKKDLTEKKETEQIISKPQLIRSKEIYFPKEASKLGINSGQVKVIFDINEFGKPVNVRIKESSNSIFNNIAISATERSVYKPALNENREGIYTKNLLITYDFNQ
jgi:TonB family protein